jgi:hydrogenase maturation protein HypF
MQLSSARIHVSGIVQGVGFRPFVYALAIRLGLNGWVRNTSAGVDIEVDGARQQLEDFGHALRTEAPPLAHIDSLDVQYGPAKGFTAFEIVHSQAVEAAFQPISPDVCICPDCLREVFDHSDRRYRYPFINCTNCGPRFSIIQDIPYDRPNTTMAPFPMCADCAAEYRDPLDRRFHAQPVACPACGPQVWLERSGDPRRLSGGDQAIRQARTWLREGKIVAVKGLGGFHLACDATNLQAVETLRQRKLRVGKPFALMMPDLAMIALHCQLSPAEAALLESRQRPVVILERRPGSGVAEAAAPGQHTLGVMLPYTPLHYLLFADPEQSPAIYDMPPLVMTSGNLSEEPIATGNEEARQRLSTLADGFLMHNRDIHTRCDDSVVRSQPENGQIYPLRRARGYAPDPLRLPLELPPLLATGAELKNTFCLTRERYAFLSHHIGDLENYETLQSFEQGIAHFERLFRIRPERIVYDLHPDYLATRYALERACREELPAVGVQHHHAHIAAGMADNGLDGKRPVLGIALDGTGYGPDDAIWGGEFLVADYAGYQRAAHLAYVRLPGGDRAVREPWRIALAWLAQAGIAWADNLPPVKYAHQSASGSPDPLPVLQHQLSTGLNAPLTSSMGRLFDAAAAIAGVRQTVSYEAQAAIELEALAEPGETGYYPMQLTGELLDPAPLLQALVADLRAGVALTVVSARFHNGIAAAIGAVCRELRRQHGLEQVVLSGGVWQNMYLLSRATSRLQQDGFTVLAHQQVPANDGGLALGQAVIGAVQQV